MTHPVAAKFATKFQPSSDLRVGDRILARQFFRFKDDSTDGPVQGKVIHIGGRHCVVQPINPKSPPVWVRYHSIIHRFKS